MKKKIFANLIIGAGILVIGLALGLKIYKNKTNEKDLAEENQVFEVSKIQYYSNVGAISKQTTYQNPEWDLNVYQYTDIAIYLKRAEEYSVSNYIKKLTIDNIQVSKTEIGNQEIYYLNPTKFGNSDIAELSDENKIDSGLEYNIMNYENSENDVKYSIPIFFEDCSNPITLRYLNSDIVSDYKFSQSNKLQFNGSLLKTAGISLEKLGTTITFDLDIITQNDETYNIPLTLDIPIDERIYDGDIFVTE